MLVPHGWNQRALRCDGNEGGRRGESHSCAIRSDSKGHVICWGWNHYHQSDPVPKEAIVQISAGVYHTCGITQLGKLTCWGWNNHGQNAIPADLGRVWSF